MNEAYRALKLHFKGFCIRNGVNREEGLKRFEAAVRLSFPRGMNEQAAIEWLATH